VFARDFANLLGPCFGSLRRWQHWRRPWKDSGNRFILTVSYLCSN